MKRRLISYASVLVTISMVLFPFIPISHKTTALWMYLLLVGLRLLYDFRPGASKPFLYRPVYAFVMKVVDLAKLLPYGMCMAIMLHSVWRNTNLDLLYLLILFIVCGMVIVLETLLRDAMAKASIEHTQQYTQKLIDVSKMEEKAVLENPNLTDDERTAKLKTIHSNREHYLKNAETRVNFIKRDTWF